MGHVGRESEMESQVIGKCSCLFRGLNALGRRSPLLQRRRKTLLWLPPWVESCRRCTDSEDGWFADDLESLTHAVDARSWNISASGYVHIFGDQE